MSEVEQFDPWLIVRDYHIFIIVPLAIFAAVVSLFVLHREKEFNNYPKGTDESMPRGNRRKKKASIRTGSVRKEEKVSVGMNISQRGLPVAQLTTSDIPSPTLISVGLSNLIENEEEETIHLQNTAKRRTKKKKPERKIVSQEQLDFDTICNSPCISACSEMYGEEKVFRAFQYLKSKGSFRFEAEHLDSAISHLDLLEERQTQFNLPSNQHGCPPDYTDAELYEIMGRDANPRYIMSFINRYGFPPTPCELTEYVSDFHLNKPDQRTKRKNKAHFKLHEARNHHEKMELQRENSSLRLKLLKTEIQASRARCKVCQDNEVAVVVKPCQHAFCCAPCAKQLYGKPKHPHSKRDCLICNVKVVSMQTFYLS